uniref:SAF domain-containing protein n=1 Tax=Steinernema glaseri TaxID=37863 RepID=A0A1I8ANL5_9BILA
MQEQAQDYLLKQAQMYPGIATITLDASRLNAMPACTQNQVFLPSGQRLRSRMSVGVRCLSPQSWSTSIAATLSIQGHYYVTNRRINPGETINQDDLIEREGDLLALANGVVIDPEQIIGYVASQRIPLGNAIRASALRDPQSITRGQMPRYWMRPRFRSFSKLNRMSMLKFASRAPLQDQRKEQAARRNT